MDGCILSFRKVAEANISIEIEPIDIPLHFPDLSLAYASDPKVFHFAFEGNRLKSWDEFRLILNASDESLSKSFHKFVHDYLGNRILKENVWECEALDSIRKFITLQNIQGEVYYYFQQPNAPCPRGELLKRIN